ncbi:MAG: formate dehydrogenase subunit gamma [Hyphomicrobiaceae bacterium]
MSRHEAWSEERTRAIVARHQHLEGPLLPILHDVQATFGFVPEQSVPVIAQALNLSRAEVHGVVTFYHDFRRAPAGRHVLKICRAEACQAMGCEALVAAAEERLGLSCGETSGDDRVTLEAVYCLGLCANAPAAMLDGKLHGRLTAQAVERLLEESGA